MLNAIFLNLTYHSVRGLEHGKNTHRNPFRKNRTPSSEQLKKKMEQTKNIGAAAEDDAAKNPEEE